MTTRTDAPNQGTTSEALTALRALSASPTAPIADALHAAEAQAELLRDLLPGGTEQLTEHFADLMPTILVEYVPDVPGPGVSFWGNGHWHIHIHVDSPTGLQLFTLLHHLKHIIDQPERRNHRSRSAADWEALANHFARHVLAIESVRLMTLQEGCAYE